MSVYQEQFKKYADLTKDRYVNYFGLINAVRRVMVDKPEEVRANAVVLFGFSGNGKSTWISEFVKSNPDYVIVSMDEVVNKLHNKYNRKIVSSEIIEGFGNELEDVCKSGRNVIIDGSFLNLLTRSALVDTLKTFNYQVNLVDITDNILRILHKRIEDVIKERFGMNISNSNYITYVNDPGYICIQNEILSYYVEERKTSNFDEQVTYDVIDLGVDNVFKGDTPYEKITHIPQVHR